MSLLSLLRFISFMHSSYFQLQPANSFKQKKQKFAPRYYFRSSARCPQLGRALQVIPSRTTTGIPSLDCPVSLFDVLTIRWADVIVRNFINHCHFQSYIIHLPSFLEDYRGWWADRHAGNALELQWTSLLLAICACSTQHAQDELRNRLEIELGEQLEELSDRYHRTACELHDAIPISNWNITCLQQFMDSCLWYKCKARFIQAWHTLNTSVRLAQELCKCPLKLHFNSVLTHKGIDQEKMACSMSEFECEMRRRLWCVLDTWDWYYVYSLPRGLGPKF